MHEELLIEQKKDQSYEGYIQTTKILKIQGETTDSTFVGGTTSETKEKVAQFMANGIDNQIKTVVVAFSPDLFLLGPVKQIVVEQMDKIIEEKNLKPNVKIMCNYQFMEYLEEMGETEGTSGFFITLN